ncbi:MAG: zinc-ribbon domain-containing protein [Planctomycetaceae bacterium]
MSVLRISCPQCRTTLQLPDRRYLGRRGRCAACGHAFVLQEPEPEIELQPAPESAAEFPTGIELLSERSGVTAGAAPPIAAEIRPTARVEELRQRRRSRRKTTLIAGTASAVVICGLLLVLWPYLTAMHSPPYKTPSAHASTTLDEVAAAAIDAAPLSSTILKSNAALVEAARPTPGAPIDLTMLPSGVNLVIHLHPAELWSDAPAMHELRGALTQTVTDWMARQLDAVCRRKPEQIEDALIGLMLGPTGSTPEVAAVVRLKEPAKLSDLVDEFHGTPVRPASSLRLVRGPTHACFIKDERTFAICPAHLAEDLADWVAAPNENTTDGILQLLAQTDRERLFTVIFEVEDLRRHANWLFADEARPAFLHVLDVLGDECETACWSASLAEDFYSELTVRTRTAGAEEIMGANRLAETLSARFTDVPERLVGRVRTVNPRHSGARQLIGRLPAMAEAARRATVVTTDERRVQFTTLLPAKAAPNLALATLLTWDEMRQTPAGSPAPAVVADANSQPLPKTVAERLKLPVDAEFRRTPLRDALAYICDGIGVKLEIDGDALKDAGYTQNMPQTFNLGKVPADVALSRIVNAYDGGGKEELRMTVVADESLQTLLVMTRKFAAQKKLTPIELPPPPQ